MSFIRELEHLRLSLDDIKSATNDFSIENFIGVGGFGRVYKGEISNSDGRMTVAVKRLDRDRGHGQGEHEFLMEIMMLSRYQHQNLVSLLGFCDENDEKILVYEHMFHGSLDKHLACNNLSWLQRLKICCGAARGLLYLHNPSGTQQRVLHRDVKSSNILLDHNCDAKISDFGLSKIGPANQQFTFLVSNAVGTFGYCDPSYIETGILTKESDVYSFGVVLFEVMCGRLCIENYNDERRFLVRLAQHSYEQDKLDDIIDDNIKEQMDPDSLATFAAIAYRCLRKDRSERPTMAEVVIELETALEFQEKRDANVVHSQDYSASVSDFQSVMSTFMQYRLRVIAELENGDPSSENAIVTSIEFDRDYELFATAGVSRRIKVFDFSTIVDKPLEVHLPVAEISTSHKLSCLSWHKDTKSHIASSDYEGIITIWDVNSQQSVMEYKEHEKRAWSVDFSCTEPSMLISGGDDCKVKVWNTKQEKSVINIDMRANVCCVKYNPASSQHIAVGSADHHIHYYDLRNTSHPLHIFKGHRKTVSYVKFLSSDELASASTDSTSRLWDIKRNLPVRTYKGHKNVNNFVGFSVNSDFIACGSETNEVFVYNKALSKPLTWHGFGSQNMDDYEDNEGHIFISDICWKNDNTTMLAANSEGIVKVLSLTTYAATAYRKDRNEQPTMAEVVKELETTLEFQEKRDANVVHRQNYSRSVSDFQSVMSTFKQYRLRVIAELENGDPSSENAIVTSIEFDRDYELFATAGVSKRIKAFDFSTIVDKPLEVHLPVAEISTSHKLSCLSWHKDTKSHIASSDYEGIITIWDVNSQQSAVEYKEHEKRAWSVDFSCTEPSMLVSGGDDCKVKVWNTKQEKSVINIDMRANVCCVKYNPASSLHIAVGSADHYIYYYDLRNTSHPLHIFKGHHKAVSYVKFLSRDELASASIDSTSRLWDIKRNLPVRTYKGHKNVKNFVGFSVNSDFIACGSETNEVFVYHKALSKPLTRHGFGSQNMDDYEDDEGHILISAICWKNDNTTMLAANSEGIVKVLALET